MGKKKDRFRVRHREFINKYGLPLEQLIQYLPVDVLLEMGRRVCSLPDRRPQ